MGNWVRTLAHDGQLRWIGPEKGALHLAVAGIVNAFWDLWGKIEKKPVWKLLVDMTPSQLVSLVDFRYMEDCITKEEAIEMLQKESGFKKVHVQNLKITQKILILQYFARKEKISLRKMGFRPTQPRWVGWATPMTKSGVCLPCF